MITATPASRPRGKNGRFAKRPAPLPPRKHYRCASTFRFLLSGVSPLALLAFRSTPNVLSAQ